jgi:hypothetical protein
LAPDTTPASAASTAAAATAVAAAVKGDTRSRIEGVGPLTRLCCPRVTILLKPMPVCCRCEQTVNAIVQRRM